MCCAQNFGFFFFSHFLFKLNEENCLFLSLRSVWNSSKEKEMRGKVKREIREKLYNLVLKPNQIERGKTEPFPLEHVERKRKKEERVEKISLSLVWFEREKKRKWKL